MSYSAEISRGNPSCILFLLDQSYSMSDRFGGGQSGDSKAVELARAINRILQELVIKCSKDMEIYRYFQVGLIGYGANVGPALSGRLASQPLVWIDEVYQNPLRVEEVVKKVPDGAGGLVETSVKFPTWFEPVASNGTPMNKALNQAHAVLQAWVNEHPASFPPIVINITDGESTDGDPSAAAERLKALATDDGLVLLLNLHLSSSHAPAAAFPSSEDGLPDQHAKRLFRMSSELPGIMRETASEYGYHIAANSRGFVFNAGIEDTVQFLNIGTRPSNLR